MTIPQLSTYSNGQSSAVTGDQLNTFMQSGINVVGLRSFIGLSGMIVYMSGFTTSGDGGQGAFYWNSTGTGPDDNGITNIVPNGAAQGCWTRIGSVAGENSIIECGATGTNVIALTPLSGQSQISSYTNYQLFGFVAQNTTTSTPVTINVNLVGALNTYRQDLVAAGSNDFIAGTYYIVAYNSVLNSNSGGFQQIEPPLNNPTFLGTITGSTLTLSGVSAAASYTVTGSTPPVNGLYLASANTPAISANSIKTAQFTAAASAVNFLEFNATATGNGASIYARGSDSNIDVWNFPKGTGNFVTFANNGLSTAFSVTQSGTVANHIAIGAVATGNSPTISAIGSDTNLNVLLVAQGSGTLQCAAVNGQTTASAANVNVDTSGNIKKSTSSLRYKTDVRDYIPSIETVLNMRPVLYKSNQPEDGSRDYAGLIAEDIDALGLNEFVSYDDKNRPDGLMYQNMVSILINCIKNIDNRLKILEGAPNATT